MKARYWSYLFDNLNRAVDEIYCVCENDENINGCQVIRINEYVFSTIEYYTMLMYRHLFAVWFAQHVLVYLSNLMVNNSVLHT